MKTSLAGKAAIVTGAGSGINLAFARLLLRNQCNVLFADLALRPEAKEVVDAHSSPRSSARAVFQETDVREWPQLERMFDVASKEFETVDIVCPGAGVYEPPFSSFWHPPGASPLSRDLPDSSRYASLDINLLHPIRTTQLAIAHFLSREPPPSSFASQVPTHNIIHISSIAAQTSPLLAPLYNASKHGLSGFVRTLAPLDNPTHRIRVTAVAPGVIDTPLWRDNPEKLRLVDDSQEGGDEWVSVEEVAEVMGSLVDGREEVEVVSSTAGGGDGREGTRKVKVEGGLILEVSKSRVRKIEQFNDEGPKGAGNTVSNMRVADKEILEMLVSGEWGMGSGGHAAR